MAGPFKIKKKHCTALALGRTLGRAMHASGVHLLTRGNIAAQAFFPSRLQAPRALADGQPLCRVAGLRL
eukprot:NODE_28822_length_465_cov_3.201183.p2 GENE.NODE_28822_length_465_cov_3.201183~~NODE_28822_length_465_cov_3.201183.p2  ORF type:complete len:69 (-),score=6.07 NODE_28822_length_465_cov_3.201183:19-225(-)